MIFSKETHAHSSHTKILVGIFLIGALAIFMIAVQYVTDSRSQAAAPRVKPDFTIRQIKSSLLQKQGPSGASGVTGSLGLSGATGVSTRLTPPPRPRNLKPSPSPIQTCYYVGSLKVCD